MQCSVKTSIENDMIKKKLVDTNLQFPSYKMKKINNYQKSIAKLAEKKYNLKIFPIFEYIPSSEYDNNMYTILFNDKAIDYIQSSKKRQDDIDAKEAYDQYIKEKTELEFQKLSEEANIELVDGSVIAPSNLPSIKLKC